MVNRRISGNNNINRISNRSVNQIRNTANMTLNSSRSKNKTTIYLVVFIILLLLIGGLVAAYFLGYIPKTKYHYIRLTKSFLDETSCENINNESFMLKHFGYLDKTYSENPSADEREKIDDAFKKLENDYGNIRDDESISKQLDDIYTRFAEKCGS